MIKLLDYGAGNVRSVRNGIRKLGFDIVDINQPEDILNADQLIFPGVGCFGMVMDRLVQDRYVEPLIRRIKENKPTLGICVALQTLFEGSEESPEVSGLNIIPGRVMRFSHTDLSIPQMGWNGVHLKKKSVLFENYKGEKLYFVHSYRAVPTVENRDWILATTDYGGEFISGIEKGNVSAFQFHPEKSGEAGLQIIRNFLQRNNSESINLNQLQQNSTQKTKIAKRIVACLDVRTNDAGDLVVTKGDQYDVREEGAVRNLGAPVKLAQRYYEEGADEITFLNITGFRDFPLRDQPMLDVLKKTSENVFVPLTIGGGIREFIDSNGVQYTALDVASEYFRSGADKISIGSDAVYSVEDYYSNGEEKSGKSSIELISKVYGAQAVVISVDPRRIYVSNPQETKHHTIKTKYPGPNGELFCWYQCTVKGGREGRDIDAIQLVTVCEKLGAGEILLNCIDKDGTNSGFDLELINHVCSVVTIPVIASSGAGNVDHFVEVFKKSDVEAALAAGIFHRREVPISSVKKNMQKFDVESR